MAQKKRNHFVPRWLLRRFACSDSKNRDQVWLLRAGGEPFRTHINNAGSGNYFYGDPVNGLEDLFARIDDRDSRVLESVERASDLRPHAEAISRMVRLLSLRTRALREKFADTTADLLAMLEESVNDPESHLLMRAHLVRVFEAEFEKSWAEQPPEIRAVLPKGTALAIARKGLATMDIRAAASQYLVAAREKVQWDEMAARGHMNGLLKLLREAEEEPVPDGWQALSWQVARLPAASLILGDCAAFALRRGSPEPYSALDAGRTPAGLCLPIAPNALLVGTVAGQPFPTDAQSINAASAAHSFDSFFAAEVAAKERGLMPMLGKAGGLMPEQELRDIGKSAWRNLDKN